MGKSSFCQAYIKYEEQLQRIVQALDPLLDLAPSTAMHLMNKSSVWGKLSMLVKEPSIAKAGKTSIYSHKMLLLLFLHQ